METWKRRWNAGFAGAVLAASGALAGCASTDLRGDHPLAWLTPTPRAPLTGPLLVTSIASDPARRKAAATPPPKLPDPKTGAALGTVGGIGAGLAACAPTILIPISYFGCATVGAILGAAGGALVGSALTEHSVSGRNVATILADLPTDEELATAFRAEVTGRIRSGLALEAIDAGPLEAAAGSLGSQLALEIASIRGERSDAYRFRFVVMLRTVLIEGGRTASTREVEHRSVPLPVAIGHDEAVGFARYTLEAAFRTAADLVVAEQLNRDALVPRRAIPINP